MKSNPFKFGTVVNDPFFTNRNEETKRVASVLSGQNHLIIIGPRRFGKTSLVYRVVNNLDRPIIFVDMQLVNSSGDLAAMILKKVYKSYPFQRIKSLISGFRILPTVSINPVSSEIDVKFIADSKGNLSELEDVLNLCDKLSSSKRRAIIIFDEFQEIFRIDKNLSRRLRSIMQKHNNINYVFLGSQESMIREIFEKKKSPFYHFGYVLNLGKIPLEDFTTYLNRGFERLTNNYAELSGSILDVTKSHPYYTQQLSFFVWELISANKIIEKPVDQAIDELIKNQDNIYERLWGTLNTTDRMVMINLSQGKEHPSSQKFSIATNYLPVSTRHSSLKRLIISGFLIKIDKSYLFEDPFFNIWLNRKLKF